MEWNGNDKCNKKQWISNNTSENITNKISPNNVLHINYLLMKILGAWNE